MVVTRDDQDRSPVSLGDHDGLESSSVHCIWYKCISAAIIHMEQLKRYRRAATYVAVHHVHSIWLQVVKGLKLQEVPGPGQSNLSDFH